MPPRTAAALGGEPRACPASCPIGTWCDTGTGQCIAASQSGGASTSTRTAASSTAPDAPPEGLVFACTTVHGLDDEIVASDGDAATRACEALNGEPCTCAAP
jgi:hypothetical protein